MTKNDAETECDSEKSVAAPVDETGVAAENIDDDGISHPLSYYREDSYIRAEYRRENEQAARQRAEGNYVPPQPSPEQQWREIPPESGFTLRALTEAAMMIAVSLVLAVISIYVPVLSFIGYLLYPVPIAALVLRRGFRVGLTGCAALLLISCLSFGWLQALLLLLEYGMVGLFLGCSFRRGLAPMKTLGLSTVISAGGTLIDLMLSFFVSGLPMSRLVDEAGDYISEYLSLLQSYGLDASILPEEMTLEQYGEMLTSMMEKIVPGALILTAMLMTLILYLVSTKVLRRLRYNIPRLPKFAEWRMDWRWVWGVVFGLLCRLLGGKLAVDWLNTLGLNALYVFGPVLAVCGLSLLIWMFGRSKMNLAVKLLLIFVLLRLSSLSLVMLMLVGVVDSVVDLRQQMTKRQENKTN